MKLEDELRCEGYFGFGGGYLWATKYGRRHPPGEDRESYCSSLCAKREVCWYRHKGRVMFMFPALTASFMALFYDADNPHLTEEEYRGRWDREEFQRRLKRWIAETNGAADPFVSVMGGNIEDGLAVGLGGAPKELGPGTLRFPFAEARTL
jgi:hypothetical protein